MKKTARILGGLAWHQYFGEGNKETATRTAIYYLRRNGFDLPLKLEREQRDLHNLLVKTIEKFPEDQTIYSEVEEYLERRVVSLI